MLYSVHHDYPVTTNKGSLYQKTGREADQWVRLDGGIEHKFGTQVPYKHADTMWLGLGHFYDSASNRAMEWEVIASIGPCVITKFVKTGIRGDSLKALFPHWNEVDVRPCRTAKYVEGASEIQTDTVRVTQCGPLYRLVGATTYDMYVPTTLVESVRLDLMEWNGERSARMRPLGQLRNTRNRRISPFPTQPGLCRP
jgi:hypothetical protein